MKKIEKLLFTNIGKTLKRYAVASFIVETISGIIAGIAAAIGDESIAYLLISVGAPFVAYTLSMFLYGFGEIVDNSIHTNKTTSASEGNFDSLPKL